LIAAPSVPFGSHLGDIDVEIADRVGLELGLDRLFALDIGQAPYEQRPVKWIGHSDFDLRHPDPRLVFPVQKLKVLSDFAWAETRHSPHFLPVAATKMARWFNHQGSPG
jgi:hypothetical protein